MEALLLARALAEADKELRALAAARVEDAEAAAAELRALRAAAELKERTGREQARLVP